MIPRKGRPWSQRARIIAGVALGVAVILGGSAVPASANPSSPASSASVSCVPNECAANISENYPGAADECLDINSYADFCLWYSPNYENGVWVWAGGANSVPVITGSFTDGDGAVRNNAASAANVGGCEIGIYVYPNYVGDVNFLDSPWGGNLTESPPLRNNEASVELFCD